MLWCQGTQATYDRNAQMSQTDRQTDEHHGNSTMIRSNEHSER